MKDLLYKILRFVTRRPWHRFKKMDRVMVRTRQKKGIATIVALDKLCPEYLVVLDADATKTTEYRVFDFWVKEENIKPLKGE